MTKTELDSALQRTQDTLDDIEVILRNAYKVKSSREVLAEAIGEALGFFEDDDIDEDEDEDEDEPEDPTTVCDHGIKLSEFCILCERYFKEHVPRKKATT